MEYGDRKIKFIVLIMGTSGMRIEGFEYLRWGNIHANRTRWKDGTAKITIYEGDPEEYIDSFIGSVKLTINLYAVNVSILIFMAINLKEREHPLL